MYCNNCGTKNLESATFCKECGENLLQVENKTSQAEFQAVIPRKIKKKKSNALIGIVITASFLLILTLLDWKFNTFGIVDALQRQTNQGQPIMSDSGIKNSTTNQLPITSVDNNVTSDFVCGTSQVLDADGNTYGTVLVGDQCWMALNMKVGEKIKDKDNFSNNGKIEKRCYEDHDSGCDSDGGLYSWSEAMQYATIEGAQGICPADWHVPTDTEQNKLENLLKDAGENCSANRVAKGCASAGTKLQSGGTSDLNFPLAGFYYGGKYQDQGVSANFWSSSGIDSTNAWDRLVYSDKSTVVRDTSLKTNGFSVRCIKD